MDGFNWKPIALGSGFIFSSLVGWAYGSFFPRASLTDYARVMGLSFLLGFGGGCLIYSLPAWYTSVWYQWRETQRLRTEAYRFARQRDPQFSASIPAEPVIVQDYSQEWRTFHLWWIRQCVACLGNPAYREGMDKHMLYEVWRVGADAWVRHGALTPIAQGRRTEWAEGWGAGRALGLIEGGALPPCPAGSPPKVQTGNV